MSLESSLYGCMSRWMHTSAHHQWDQVCAGDLHGSLWPSSTTQLVSPCVRMRARTDLCPHQHEFWEGFCPPPCMKKKRIVENFTNNKSEQLRGHLTTCVYSQFTCKSSLTPIAANPARFAKILNVKEWDVCIHRIMLLFTQGVICRCWKCQCTTPFYINNTITLVISHKMLSWHTYSLEGSRAASSRAECAAHVPNVDAYASHLWLSAILGHGAVLVSSAACLWGQKGSLDEALWPFITTAFTIPHVWTQYLYSTHPSCDTCERCRLYPFLW